MGGFVGIHGYVALGTRVGLVVECYSTGNVSSTAATTASVYSGGFIGYQSGITTAKDSFSLGNVLSRGISAGFVGFMNGSEARVENSYAITNSPNGFSTNGTIINSYFSTEFSTSTKAEGRTTQQMALIATYENWDFQNIWIMNRETGYPELRFFSNLIDMYEDDLEDICEDCLLCGLCDLPEECDVCILCEICKPLEDIDLDDELEMEPDEDEDLEEDLDEEDEPEADDQNEGEENTEESQDEEPHIEDLVYFIETRHRNLFFRNVLSA